MCDRTSTIARRGAALSWIPAWRPEGGCMIRVVVSTSASSRLAAAFHFLITRQPAAECVIVGASRGAPADLAREASRQAGATFGIARFSLTELAARAAAIELAASRR